MMNFGFCQVSQPIELLVNIAVEINESVIIGIIEQIGDFLSERR